ncbi:MBL fold metallo-hydrolase [Paractinoplanes globisporus]|uniref:MBL fold metallo-hydrolase n=1 Tax=Paractinoplanes globisporus TaxID=113565 RepID=A0ABW6W9G9_9ACTN|nr:MBL fold metallo-hydrolase [Actinoplanes globisporus]
MTLPRAASAGQFALWNQGEVPEAEPVLDDVWCVPLPPPHGGRHATLSYLFPAPEGFLLLDAGWDHPSNRTALRAGVARAGGDLADIRHVVLTHAHPDHYGLAAWLRREHGAVVRAYPDRLPGPRALDALLPACGVPEAERAAPPPRLPTPAMPAADVPLADGAVLRWGDHELTAVLTPGHTPGHVCLYDRRRAAIWTGDHLLPRISPNVSAYAVAGADPLGDYLRSLERVAGLDARMALPGHEYAFLDPARRARDLAAGHQERLAAIAAALARRPGVTCWEITAALPWSRPWAVNPGWVRMAAVRETLAHLIHLEVAGRARRTAAQPQLWSSTE